MDKSISSKARKEMLNSIRQKYQSSNWNDKKKLLDGFVLASGYDRKYAIKLLNSKLCKGSRNITNKRGRKPFYDESVIQVLKQLWNASNQICSKRIIPFIPELLESLERHGHLVINDITRHKVLTISSSTFDRLLKAERKDVKQGISTTTSGTLLKNQIKVRTFTDWNEKEPGFFEADLVAHCGTTVTGAFMNTLVMTDIVTTWTECIPLIRKSADDVILGLDTAKKLLPFNILGFDVDNGCEFINYDVMEYCTKNKITFTRSRAYKKNDQAHVEQKNGSIVRRLIGYERYEGEVAWEALSRLYAVLRLYINFFQPTLKLESKMRKGSKTIKKYEQAKTPYQRVIQSEHISQTTKDILTRQYLQLDPVTLMSEISKLQNELWKLSWSGDIMPVIDDALDSKEAVVSLNEVDRHRKLPKTSKKRAYRTRSNPFESVQNEIRFEMEIKPNVTAKEILERLMSKYPNKFYEGHIRTLQRRMSELRKEFNQRELKYDQIMVNKRFMVTNPVENIL